MKGGFWSEFRSFAVRGNVVDLAIAVIIGNAFSGVINALVGGVMTPLLGLLTNNVDFKTLSVTMGPNNIIAYGLFLQALFNFFVVAFSIFFIFRIVAAARKRVFKDGEKAVPQEEKPAVERLLEEIRDLLKAK